VSGGAASGAGVDGSVSLAPTLGALNLSRTGGTIGTFGVAAVVQHATTGQTAGYTANITANFVYDASTFTGGVGATAYTVGDVVRALKNLGLMAS
jgi:hypothetical protein